MLNVFIDETCYILGLGLSARIHFMT